MSAEGWVKLTDPATGKEFYANKFTRQTQWEAPPGFIDPATTASLSNSSASFNPSRLEHSQHSHGSGGQTQTQQQQEENDLPPNWERMKDEATGRFFYVDHVHKKTTWEHPGKFVSNSNGHFQNYLQNTTSSMSSSALGESRGIATGFGFVPASSSISNAAATATGSNLFNAQHENGGTSSKPSSSSPHFTATSWKNSHSMPHTAASHSHYEYSYKPSITAIDDQSTKYYSTILPHIDFKVVKVPDSLRSSCPSCNAVFSLSKRRHHCRLCGDVFCDACSSHRVILPLGGVEFEKPVRVCKECHVDVDKGNYFSMRRYLTPLLLYDEEKEAELQKAFGNVSLGTKKNDDGSVVESIDAKKVSAALSSLTQDLDAVMLDATSFGEKVTIPPDVLVPAISRHLLLDETCDRAIKALSTLLSLGSMVGDDSFAATVFLQKDASRVLESICKLLEWSGTSTKTLAVQEQVCKTVYYLTDKRVISNILEMEEANGSLLEEGWINSAVMMCDVPRVLRSILDHTTCTTSSSLQRWAAACIRNLISEDERRGCEAVSEAMSMGYSELRYESFISELVSSGGAMILSSLVSSDDADTRAHAMAALSQIIDAARALNVRLKNFMEAYQVQNIQTCSETAIIDAVVSSGACGPSLAQLLLSADNDSAAMACNFARSLVYPIISNPLGSSVPRYHRLFSSDRKLIVDDDGLKEYREAALNIGASDGVLSALVNLLKDNYGAATRPIELRRLATQILAAIAHTLAYWESEIKNAGKPIETMDESVLRLHEKISIAVTTLEEEHTADAIISIMSSSTAESLNSSRDTPSSQLRESAALIITALCSCSHAIAETFIRRNVLARLISLSMDDGFDTPSSRGQWSSRRLPMLEATASLLIHGWKIIQKEAATNNGKDSSTMSLELLLEALDSGIVPLISRLLSSRQQFSSSEKVYADTRTNIAVYHCIAAMFGIARCDSTKIGYSRIFEAIGNRHPIISQVLSMLGLAIPEVQGTVLQGRNMDKDLPMNMLLEAILLAGGSICGSEFLSFGSLDFHRDYDITPGIGSTEKDIFSTQLQEICISTCDVISKNSFLPAALVGSFGEGAILPTLRVLSTVAENSSTTSVHRQIIRSGVLLPVTDMLKEAMNAGDYYVFDACVATIGYSGPQMNSSAENNSIQALRDSVKMFANIITIKGDKDGPDALKLKGLKEKCIKAVDMLSLNPSLWTVIVAHFVPNFLEKWLTVENAQTSDAKIRSIVCSGLQTIIRVIALPTHAVFVANTGLAATLSNIICSQDDSRQNVDTEVEGMAIKIIKTLLSYSEKKGPAAERVEAGVVDVYALDVACHLLSRDDDQDYNSAMLKTKLALEILLTILDTFDDIHESDIAKSTRIIGFMETAVSYESFLRKLFATAQFSDAHDSDSDMPLESLYGKPICLFEGVCGRFERSADAAINILCWICFYSVMSHSQNSRVVWDTIRLEGKDVADHLKKNISIIFFSASYLNVLSQEKGINRPKNPSKLFFFQETVLPIVQERLLSILSGCSKEILETSGHEMGSFQEICVRYRIPQLCLQLSNNDSLIELAFEILELSLVGFPRSILESVISDKPSLTSLLTLLEFSGNTPIINRHMVGKIRVFSAAMLSSAGNLHLLGSAVNSLGLRSFAIASLSAPCLVDDDDIEALIEDITEEGSSMSTLCLNGLIDVLSSSTHGSEQKIMLSAPEARAISSGLGKKLSSMVIERFVQKAEREHVLGDVGIHENMKQFPEVTLLCALASSKDALTELCTCGGLEALSLVAGEGELSAINALLEVCKVDPHIVLTVDGHVSALQVISRSSDITDQEPIKACLSLLIMIATNSTDGRDSISNSDECVFCMEHASSAIKRIATQSKTNSNSCLEEIVEHKSSSSPEIEYDVLLFLTSLIPNKKCREIIFSDEEFLPSIEKLATEGPTYELQHAALLYLDSCARFIQYDAADNHHDSDIICSSLLNIIDSSQIRRKTREIAASGNIGTFGSFSKTHQFNENLVLASTCQVLEALIPNLPLDLLSKVLQSLSAVWNETLPFHCSLSRRATSRTRNSGNLMFNISSIFLLLVGRNEAQNLFKDSNVIEDLLYLIIMDVNWQENKNARNETDDSVVKDIKYWRGAVSQSLQCVAVLTMNPMFVTSDGKGWLDMIANVEQNESPPKPAGKIRVFTSTVPASEQRQSLTKTLENVANNSSDPICSITAKKIMNNLFL